MVGQHGKQNEIYPKILLKMSDKEVLFSHTHTHTQMHFRSFMAISREQMKPTPFL